MKRMALVVFGFVALGAECDLEEPCQDYIDYVCSCHADDPDYDCQEIRNAFSDAGSELQDQCAIDLAELEEDDDATSFECAAR